VRCGPLFRMACHSSLDFSTGNDILGELDVLNRDPMNGMVGIDLRIVAREKGWRVRCAAGKFRVVALKVWNVRIRVGKEGKRIDIVVGSREEGYRNCKLVASVGAGVFRFR
jgi:hypothetical protein